VRGRGEGPASLDWVDFRDSWACYWVPSVWLSHSPSATGYNDADLGPRTCSRGLPLTCHGADMHEEAELDQLISCLHQRADGTADEPPSALAQALCAVAAAGSAHGAMQQNGRLLSGAGQVVAGAPGKDRPECRATSGMAGPGRANVPSPESGAAVEESSVLCGLRHPSQEGTAPVLLHHKHPFNQPQFLGQGHHQNVGSWSMAGLDCASKAPPAFHAPGAWPGGWSLEPESSSLYNAPTSTCSSVHPAVMQRLQPAALFKMGGCGATHLGQSPPGTVASGSAAGSIGHSYWASSNFVPPHSSAMQFLSPVPDLWTIPSQGLEQGPTVRM
jgi:hypothetical protein